MDVKTILYIFCIAFVLLNTKYNQIGFLVLFTFFLFNVSSILRVYPFRYKMEKYSADRIQVGDIICTHLVYARLSPTIIIPKVYTVLTGDIFFHTVLVINHNGEKYVLNPNNNPLPAIREFSSYKDKVEDLMKKNGWYMSIEPLESFIENTRREEGLAIQVVSTKQDISIQPNILEKIKDNPQRLLHCCYFVSKYLEHLGLIKNDTMLNDAIYYNPSNVTGLFGPPRYFSLE